MINTVGVLYTNSINHKEECSFLFWTKCWLINPLKTRDLGRRKTFTIKFLIGLHKLFYNDKICFEIVKIFKHL